MRLVFNGLSGAPNSTINTIYQFPISHRPPPFRSSYPFQSLNVYILSDVNTTLFFSYLPILYIKQNLTLTTLFVQKSERITNTRVQAYTKVLQTQEYSLTQKSFLFLSASTLRYNRRSKHRTAIFKRQKFLRYESRSFQFFSFV